MAKKMLIDATHPEETRVVVVDGSRIEEFDYETITKVQISGNIYLAKVTRVEPSLQAAFVEYGGARHGFLAFSEIHPDYYQIPVADREALLAAERAAQRDDEFDDEDEDRPRRSDRRGGRRSGRSEQRANDDGEEGSRDRRRKGRRRDNSRRRGLSLGSVAEAAAPSAELIAAAAEGERQESQSRAALTAAAEAAGASLEDEAKPDLPDLSDVVEIEIRRAPSEAEAADGADVVVEKINVAEFAAAGEAAAKTGAQAEAAGAPTSISLAEAIEAPEQVTEKAGEDSDSEEDVVAAEQSSSENAEDDSDDEEKAEISARDAEDADSDDSAQETAEDSDNDSENGGSDIETLGDEDAREEMRPRRARLRDYRIQEVIKRRQIMLVQVVKEERGTKGAALTTYLSLAGRYCVLMPNTARGGGISRKITNAADRKRLKSVTQELEVPEGMGLIVRTAGANRTKAEIKRDFEYLLRQWAAIRELTLKSIAPSLIYEEGSLVKRAIRDLYNKDIEAILVEGEEAYREAKDYMKMLMPSHAKNVQPYRENTPLFARHQVENQIGAMMNPTVPLKSGGYLVIGVTEALVAVDVNSGRSTKEGSIEDTALKTNLEAAEEAARQMRLRDLAGLIVIDFIDMEESKNNRAVEKRLKDRLKDDRARIQVGRISGFGLLEMSRQRLRPGLLEATTAPCPHCKGAGLVRSEESMALTILRAVEEEAGRGRSPAVRIGAPVSVANYLMNQKRARIAMIEERHDIQVHIEADHAIVSPDYAIERVKPIAREEPASRAIQLDAVYDDLDPYEEEEDEELEAAETASENDSGESEAAKDGESRGRRRRRRRDRGGDSDGDQGDLAAAEADSQDDGQVDGDSEGEDTDSDADERAASDEEPRKRRGRRGGRRRRRKSEDGEAETMASDDGGERGSDADSASESDPLPVFASSEADAEESVEETAQVSGSDNSGADTDSGSDFEGVSEVAEPNAERNGHEPVDARPDAVEVENGRAQTPPDALTTSEEPLAEAGGEPALAASQAATASAPSRPRRTGWWSFGR